MNQLNHKPFNSSPRVSQPDASFVQKYVLDNGLTILVRSCDTVPKVAIQLWYGVGSKDEQTGERGIAHLLEHMVFKGTVHNDRVHLSESDINTVTHMLSGTCNAFTSYDYTGYIFNFPTQHYHEAFPILADCMRNCRFDDQMLNSEIKAVIQELKLYKDQPTSSLLQEMIGAIFADHPYHHPIIGYKQDLWSVSGNDLHNFYQKHYASNNATLVVVGDVQPQEVFVYAQRCFGDIPPSPDYRKAEYFFNQDIMAKSVTLFRDIQQPCLVYAFVIPGARTKNDYVVQIIEWVLAKGKGSRLYKKLVNDLQYVTSVEIGCWDLFDHSLFFISLEPVEHADHAEIEAIILAECADIAQNGLTDQELERAIKKTQSSLYSLMEDVEDQAYAIGKSFLATGDPDYSFTMTQKPLDELKKEVQAYLAHYFRPCVMHKGAVLPLPQNEQNYWLALQEASDQEDEQILSVRTRTTPVEPPLYAEHIAIQEPKKFDYPKPTINQLENGLSIYSYHNPLVPKISLVLSLKMNNYYEAPDKQGLCNFMTSLLTEGTQNYTAQELADFVESKGMSLRAYPGGIMISVLKDDLKIGLAIMQELMMRATFVPEEVEKIRTHLLVDLNNFWDDATLIAGQLVREHIYKNHPYSLNVFGTKESIGVITRDEIINFYQQSMSAHGAHLAIVGDIAQYDVPTLVQETLGVLSGHGIPDLVYPPIQQVSEQEYTYRINRDQVVLVLARPSVSRFDADYNALLVFDQIFGAGVLGSMSSRLFELREQSGLFYGIDGSFASGAYEQPGMLQVKTVVSLDRLAEAEQAIKETIAHAADTITEQEFNEAKRALVNSSVDNFASNMNIARTFLHMQRYKLPRDFFDTRAQMLEKISIADMQHAVRKIIGDGAFFVLKAGRV